MLVRKGSFKFNCILSYSTDEMQFVDLFVYGAGIDSGRIRVRQVLFHRAMHVVCVH